MKRRVNITILTFTGLLASALLTPRPALAHRDGMDAPVVKAAQKGLAAGNVNLALAWIRSRYEAEVRQANSNTQAIREINAEPLELADRFFFETPVRIHRAGTGAPFSGLQPSGRDMGPAMPAAEKALQGGSADSLAGREYLRAHVAFIHYVAEMHETVYSGGHEPSSQSQFEETLAHQHQ